MADFIACRANVLGNYCTKSVNLNRKRALSIVAVTARISRRESIHVCLSSTERRSWPTVKVKGKVFPYSLPSVGPGADLGVQAVSPQVT